MRHPSDPCYSPRAPVLTVPQTAAPCQRVLPVLILTNSTPQGAIDFLTSADPAAARLRQYFVFKLVPMLNPDGVINGSYRSSLIGQDLNRVWDRPEKGQHPTIYHTRKLLEWLSAAGKLAVYVDLHGHSRKEDTFFYGCEPGTSYSTPAPPPEPVAERRRPPTTSVDATPKKGQPSVEPPAAAPSPPQAPTPPRMQTPTPPRAPSPPPLPVAPAAPAPPPAPQPPPAQAVAPMPVPAGATLAPSPPSSRAQGSATAQGAYSWECSVGAKSVCSS